MSVKAVPAYFPNNTAIKVEKRHYEGIAFATTVVFRNSENRHPLPPYFYNTAPTEYDRYGGKIPTPFRRLETKRWGWENNICFLRISRTAGARPSDAGPYLHFRRQNTRARWRER